MNRDRYLTVGVMQYHKLTHHCIQHHVNTFGGNIGSQVPKESHHLLRGCRIRQASQFDTVLLAASHNSICVSRHAALHIQAQQVNEVVLLFHRTRARQHLKCRVCVCVCAIRAT